MTDLTCQVSLKLRYLSLYVAGCGFDALMLHSVHHEKAVEIYKIATRLQDIANDLDALQMDAAWPDALERVE